MTAPDFSPKAIVPQHLIQLEVATIPLDVPYYLTPDSSDEHDLPNFLVFPDGSLNVRRSAEVDGMDKYPSDVMGHVGLMRIFIGSGLGEEALVADLRYIGEGGIKLATDIDKAPDDPEDFNEWLEIRKDFQPVQALIASEDLAMPSKKGVIRGEYHGPEMYSGALDVLRVRGDKLLAKFLKRQKEVFDVRAKVEEAKTKDSVTGERKTTPAQSS